MPPAPKYCSSRIYSYFYKRRASEMNIMFLGMNTQLFDLFIINPFKCRRNYIETIQTVQHHVALYQQKS